jgi:hypothetical protein
LEEYHCITHSFIPEGLTVDVLQSDFWVPQSTTRADSPQFRGKDVFREILTPTDETATLYAMRATEARVSV